jgi:hypothetical protein
LLYAFCSDKFFIVVGPRQNINDPVGWIFWD